MFDGRMKMRLMMPERVSVVGVWWSSDHWCPPGVMGCFSGMGVP